MAAIMGRYSSNLSLKRVAAPPLRRGESRPRRAKTRIVLLGLAVCLMSCDRDRTTQVVRTGGDPNALVRLEITSNPTGQVWIANIGDEDTVITINGTTPFSQDFPAPDGLGAAVRKVSAGGDLHACVTNLTTGVRRCGTTSAPGGIVSVAVAN